MNRKLIGATTAGAALLMFSAVAAAQTTPGVTPSASAQATGSATGSVTVSGTASTAVATASGTAGAVGSGTAVSSTPIAIPTNIYQPGGTGNFPFADPAFQQTWARTDAAVKSGEVKRTYFWGPGPNSIGLLEPYQQGPGGQHLVQYFDKSRMEINNPAANRNEPFFVTNGLLTVDMIAGSIQVGDKTFQQFHPACIPMSGDFGDQLAPTYASFQKVSVNGNRVDAHPAANRTGQNVTETIDRNGTTGTDASKANVPGVKLAFFDATTKHNIPSIFWDFLNQSGPVRDASGKTVQQQLQNPWFYAVGLPISEPYWAKATINGKATDVLIQAFERRALTYVPTNPTGFQVEMANIGQHYFDWRYRNLGNCSGGPAPTGTPVAAPSGTAVVATGTPVAAGTRTPTETPTINPSVTVIVPTTTVVTATVPSPSASASASASPAASGTATPGASATTTATPIR